MNGRARLTRCSTTAASPATSAALGAERLRQRGGDDDVAACRRARARAPGRSRPRRRRRARAPRRRPAGRRTPRTRRPARPAARRRRARSRPTRRPPARGARRHPPGLATTAATSLWEHDGHVGAAEPDGVDQRGVHVGVGDDQALAVDERGDRRQVGVVAGRQHEGRGLAEEAGEVGLELGVQRQGAGDQPRGAGAGAPGPCCFGGRGDDGRVAREAEVVVAGQVERAVVGRSRPQAASQVELVAPSCLLAQPGLPGIGGVTRRPPRLRRRRRCGATSSSVQM